MDGVPVGFLMTLSQNMEAMQRFAALPSAAREAYIARARSVRSRAEMDALIKEI